MFELDALDAALTRLDELRAMPATPRGR